MALRYIDIETPELPAAQPIDTSAMEVDMGDQAGLQPLPLGRMFQQAGRPMSPQSRNQDTPWYGRNTSLKVDPALHDLTIQRNQRNQQTIENWDPIKAENQQRLNNTNPNPRSRPSAPDNRTTVKFFGDLANTAEFRKRKAFSEAARNDPTMWSKDSKEFGRLYGQDVEAQRKTDASLFLTSQERAAVKSMVFDYLDSRAGSKNKLDKESLPVGINSRFPKLGNDLLYEWNARRARQMREGTLDMLEIRRDTIRGI